MIFYHATLITVHFTGVRSVFSLHITLQ